MIITNITVKYNIRVISNYIISKPIIIVKNYLVKIIKLIVVEILNLKQCWHLAIWPGVGRWPRNPLAAAKCQSVSNKY